MPVAGFILRSPTMTWTLAPFTESVPYWLAILEQATVPTPKVLD